MLAVIAAAQRDGSTPATRDEGRLPQASSGPGREPLRWSRGEDGCELKSAGPDPADDEDDLVWRLPCDEVRP